MARVPLICRMVAALAVLLGTVAACSGDAGDAGDGALPKGFVHLADVAPGVLQAMAYYSDDNFVGRRVNGYEAPVCILTEPAARALARVQAALERSGLGLQVRDCYRPQRAVNDFMVWAADLSDLRTKAAHYPNLAKIQIIPLGYVAEKSGHSRGSTVDLTVVGAATGQPLDFGTPYDLFDPLANTDNPAIAGPARANRDMLVDVMAAEGFSNYPKEWWHFTLKNEPFPDTYFDFPVR